MLFLLLNNYPNISLLFLSHHLLPPIHISPRRPNFIVVIRIFPNPSSPGSKIPLPPILSNDSYKLVGHSIHRYDTYDHTGTADSPVTDLDAANPAGRHADGMLPSWTDIHAGYGSDGGE